MTISETANEEYTCRHAEHRQATHVCPFQYDVHNDREFKCTCCERCEQQCADDI